MLPFLMAFFDGKLNLYPLVFNFFLIVIGYIIIFISYMPSILLFEFHLGYGFSRTEGNVFDGHAAFIFEFFLESFIQRLEV